MDSGQDELEGATEDNGWSLLYAPATALQPSACAECGNVFAAESKECPWCGRPVGSLVDGPRHELGLGSSAALLIPQPSEAPGDDPAADPTDWVGPTAGQQARRWAGVLVAAGVLLAIATGVTVRSRENGDEGAAAPATTAVTRTAAPATSTPATTAATRAPVATTAPATTAPAISTPATSTAATVVATSAVTAAPTTAGTVAPTSTTDAGPSLSAVEQRAVTVTRDLNDAIVRKDWDEVRALAPKNAATDDTYQRFWGSVEAATVVPARVAAVPGGEYDVFVGVVSVSRIDGVVATSVVCGRYTVDPAAGTVGAVVTKELRKQPGVIEAASVATELRTACREPGL